MKVILRPYTPSDLPFIFATYLRHCWFNKDQQTTLKRSTWSAMQHKRLEALFVSEVVLIACLNEDPDFIVGYGFIDNDRLFTYLKKSFRSEGLNITNLLLKGLK